MRYPTRASEFDHRRLQVLPSPLHDPPLINFTLASVKNVPAVPAVLDKGHQRKPPPWPAIADSEMGHNPPPALQK
jgi:hypothetical protein